MDQKKWLNFLLVIEVIILIIVGIFGILVKKDEPVKTARIEQENDDWEEDIEDSVSVSKEISIERLVFSDEIERRLSEMTLEEKVAQMFFVTPESLTGVENVTVAGETSKAAINTYPVGGLEISTANYEDTEQFCSLIAGFQQYSQERIGVDLFVGAIEIGGEEHSDFALAGLYEMQSLPSEIGANGTTDSASNSAAVIANGLVPYGINMNLALISDLSNGNNSEYDMLTFGSNAGTVSEYVTTQISSYRSNGMTAVMRSFPGYSFADFGNGNGFPMNQRTIDEMRSNELIVYQAGIDAGAEVIMVANMTAEALTGDSVTPCSFSGATTNLLREEMGYTGLIMSGNLSNSCITNQYDSAEAAVNAVKAGMDILYKPADFVAAYNAVIEAVGNGEIDQILIDNAVGRIFTLKYK